MRGLEIIGRLAAGAMGEVFLARQRGPGGFARIVAVKRVLLDDDELSRRLLDEARLNACVAHPNVVGVIGVGQDEDGPYLVLEYVDGGTLAMLCRRANAAHVALPIDACVRIAHDVASGLHAAHTRAIVHRDVKPSNILVGVDGRARIGDFGIALDRDMQRRAERLAAHTSTGGIRGTLPYMSPEQIRSLDVTAATDQYSLGVALWEALTGHHLFPDADLVARLVEAPAPSARALRHDVPRGLDDVVARMLAFDPDDRFATCAQAAAALDAAWPIAGAEESVAACLEEIAGTAIRRKRARLLLEAGAHGGAPGAHAGAPGAHAGAPGLVPGVSAANQTQIDGVPFMTTGSRTREMTDDELRDVNDEERDARNGREAHADSARSAPESSVTPTTSLHDANPSVEIDVTSVTATAPTLIGAARASHSRARRVRTALVTVAGASGLIVALALGAVARAGTSAGDADSEARTHAFLAERAVADPVNIQAIVVAESVMRDVPPAIFDPIAVRMAEHARKRVALIDAHLRLAPEQREKNGNMTLERSLDALDVEVKQTLAPLGSDAAAGSLQIWEMTRFSVIIWMPAAPKVLHPNIADSFLAIYDRWPMSDTVEVIDHFARVTNARNETTTHVSRELERLLGEKQARLKMRWRASESDRERIDAELARIDSEAYAAIGTLEPALGARMEVLYEQRLRIPPLDEPYPVSPLRLSRPEPLAYTLGAGMTPGAG